MEKIFGLSFYNKSIDELISDLKMEMEKGHKVSIFTPNVDHIINNFANMKAQEVYKKSEYIIADGWPLVATAKLKKKTIKRITGVDLMEGLLEIANKENCNVYFLGAEDETLKKLRINILKKYPNIKNIGMHNGYFDNNEYILKDINKNGITMLFVGMGNPKQEIWIRENFELINANLILGVGGAFKIFSGEVDRAPIWIQNIGMEWFYRFLKEPKRLFKRYFIKYPKFLKILFKELRNND